jgi:RNA polymerase sigma-70 factor (ECF subfamily)
MKLFVKRAQRGDPEAFVSLIEANKSGMYRVAKGFFQSEDDVADAISETVLSAYEHIGELKKAEYFRTWLIRILINVCNQMVREHRRCEVTEVLPELRYTENDFSNVEFQEMLASFPEDCRTILLLYYGEQFTTREIAEILGMKENTVKSRLRRSRESLRETMVYSL